MAVVKCERAFVFPTKLATGGHILECFAIYTPRGLVNRSRGELVLWVGRPS